MPSKKKTSFTIFLRQPTINFRINLTKMNHKFCIYNKLFAKHTVISILQGISIAHIAFQQYGHKNQMFETPLYKHKLKLI